MCLGSRPSMAGTPAFMLVHPERLDLTQDAPRLVARKGLMDPLGRRFTPGGRAARSPETGADRAVGAGASGARGPAALCAARDSLARARAAARWAPSRSGGAAVIIRLKDVLVIQPIRAKIHHDPLRRAAGSGRCMTRTRAARSRSSTVIRHAPGRGAGRERGRQVAPGVRRALHGARGRAGHAVRHALAHEHGAHLAQDGRGDPVRAGRPSRLPVRSSVQPGVQRFMRISPGPVDVPRGNLPPRALLTPRGCRTSCRHSAAARRTASPSRPQA